ncbi:glycosyltransferase family 4 protein [Nocardioides nitrophenolicus]|uniref:glycosyltransferase family 4 protein n=1 Tax=Nocardioides nitrophenolicus TaxID=60489 RepID=UPI001959AB45|nr:glycosyltransferase family 4 protein [Nocardioides nitrophenolicus]MBM7520314.1 glycosyltransferase involved in cell wall biosynthesis [Nocardioides nitrophenolicus]
MRVLQLITQGRGGPVDHAVEVAIELARQGHDSHLAGPPGPHLAAAAEHAVTVHVAPVDRAGDLRGVGEVRRVLAAVDPDVVHLQDRRAGLVGRVLAGPRSVPTVYTLHGVPDRLAGLVPGNLPLARPRRRDRLRYLGLEGLLARTPRSAVVTPCQALAAYARDHVGIAGHRVHAVPNGVGRHWLGQQTGPAADPGPVRVVWLGLMQPVKRLPDLVAAVDRVPGVRLRLVGDGPERSRVEAAAAGSTHPERFAFAGFDPDPVRALRAADVVALPSAAEAFPMALLQAMALGRPVLATRVGGVPELVRHARDGLLVDAGDVGGLARALTDLATDAVLRRRLGESARLRVRENYAIDRTTRALVDVYEGVAG